MRQIQSWARPRGLNALIPLIVFLGCASPAWAGKPGGGTPPVDSGTVFFRHYNGSCWQVWSMLPNGSARTALPIVNVDVAEPSKALHAGQRWFLTVQNITGEFYPPRPDGAVDPRQEVFAVSAAGDWVQLTDDPSLQPVTWFAGRPETRWTLNGAGTVDGRITFLGRRWGVDELGNPVILETGLYYVDLNPADLGAGLPAQAPTLSGSVTLPAAYSADYGWHPQVVGYDWSPDSSSPLTRRYPAMSDPA